MELFANLFRGKGKQTAAVLVDVGADSIGGAYATFSERGLPMMHYAKRIPVDTRHGELLERSVLRALRTLADTLIREGAPALARATGSGRAPTILVSIDAPWQKTSVRTEHIEKERKFTFTRELVAEAVGRTSSSSDKLLVDESVVGAVLNGYETRDPYGKKASRASVVVLTSLIDAQMAKHVTTVLREAYHSEDIRYAAGSSLRFQALYTAFPHERDALIIDVPGPHTSIMLVRNGLFAAIADIKDAPTATAWVRAVESELSALAKTYPLPRVVFLLARDTTRVSIRETLDAARLERLWLSDHPPKTISVLPGHLGGLVRQMSAIAPDTTLLLMAFFFQAREMEERF